MWMTAAGNEEKAKKARQLIQAAIIGLIIVVGAYAITVFVMARISKDLITGSASGGSDVTSGGSYDGSGKSDSAGSGALGCCVNYPEVQVPMSGAPDCTDMPDDTNCGPPLLNFTFYGGVSCADVPACNGDITGGCCVNNVTVIPGPLTYECSYVTSIDLCGPPLADPVFHPGSLCTPAIGCP